MTKQLPRFPGALEHCRESKRGQPRELIIHRCSSHSIAGEARSWQTLVRPAVAERYTLPGDGLHVVYPLLTLGNPLLENTSGSFSCPLAAFRYIALPKRSG